MTQHPISVLATTSGTETWLGALIIDVRVFGVTGDALLRSSTSISDLGDTLRAESKSSEAEFSLSMMIFLREAIQRYEKSFHSFDILLCSTCTTAGAVDK